MAREIHIHHSKALKLSNCLLLVLSKEEDFEQLQDFQITIQKH
jgi:hypothetical protein